MKKFYYLWPAVGLILTGCASDGPEDNSQKTPVDYTAKNYVTINMVTSSGLGLGTKADVNEDDYVSGSSNENEVDMVRFFFFDGDGDPTAVWVQNAAQEGETEFLSYIDWYPNAGNIDNTTIPSETVEKTLTATLGLNVPGGYENPELVVAILNPTAEILNLTEPGAVKLEGPSLETLQATINDYYTGLHNENFVMSNSAYVDKDEKGQDYAVYATSINTDEDDVNCNFSSTIEGAEAHPLTIYVERVLARLDFMLNLSNDTEQVTADDGSTYTVYLVSTENVGQTESMPIYLKLLGWNITSTPTKSRLIKSIDAAWGANAVLGNLQPWNISELHRSFWAMNPNKNDYTYIYSNFNGPVGDNNLYPASGQAIPSGNDATTIYLQENASPYQATGATIQAPESPTQVVIAGQLVNADGSSISLAEYKFKKYTVNGLLNYLVGGDLRNLYYKTSVEGTDTYTQIGTGDIEFVTAQQLANGQYGVTAPADDADYYVYVVLSSTGKGKTWYFGEGDDAQPVGNFEAVNRFIVNQTNHVMVWNTGYTYYYFDVKHLGALGSPGYYGIVRNHIYQTTVSKIEGLGTPVYDPNQTIYPEKPEYNESIIQAQIKILQWRLVDQQYELDW